MSAPARLRPRLHFTARQGWTNDPHGIVHVDGRYHMFFQYNPDSVNWSPRCHWGHALSDDLITWEEAEVALSPQDGEVGCWSGSAVVDDRAPVIAYTRIPAGDWARGQVALARPSAGMLDWVREPPHAVISGPPEDLDIVAFRDPQVRRQDGAWKAVLGAGLAGLGGCALQYASEDLQHWTFDGILAVRANAERDPVWTGQVWECPQLLQVGDDWVLIMSVWDNHRPYDVAYAIGDYDGRATFTARRYGHFSHGAELYATTTFRDVEGRPCAMSWLRERGTLAPEGSPWCSAMSLPHVLGIVDGALTVSQHPALEAVLSTTSALGDAPPGGGLEVPVPGPVWRLRFRVNGYRSGGFALTVTGDGQSFALNTAGESLSAVDSWGAVLLKMPISPTDSADVDIVVDADILEITLTGTEGIAATRIPVSGSGDIRISPLGRSSITGARLFALLG
ncbi:MAG TPA: glycoside hydrolase family 32 protein [Dehalococcoidia bacterium]|nr:glycoside hydrolase family 32 protein [Dehalococcoidia bacterium]